MSTDILNIARYEVKNGCIAKVWKDGRFSFVLTESLDELRTSILCDELNKLLLSAKIDFAIETAIASRADEAKATNTRDDNPIVYVYMDGYTSCALCGDEYVASSFTKHIARIPDETGENWEDICWQCTEKNYPVLDSKIKLVSDYGNALGNDTLISIALRRITSENPELDMTLSEFKVVLDESISQMNESSKFTWAAHISNEAKEKHLMGAVIHGLEANIMLWRGGFNGQCQNEELQKFMEMAAAFVDKHRENPTTDINPDDLAF